MRRAVVAAAALVAFTTGCGADARAGSVDLDVATWVNTDESGMFSSALLEGTFVIEKNCLTFESDGERFVPVFPRAPVDIRAFAKDDDYGLGGMGGLPSAAEYDVPASCEQLGYDYWLVGP
ncbi:hypothetical protein [Demequina sp.]|uniref:hypothetical protein n=1 Tax=Demequina sp. TaxID=2050685 RepID=UPI0025BD0D4D|nr:hypothetical protein [Demequina sp.]